MHSAHASTIRPSSPYCFTAASSPRRQAVLSHRSPPMQVKQNTAVARTRPASPARAKTHTQLQHMRHRPSLSPASCADIPPVPKTQSTPCNSNHCGPGHKRGRLQRSTRSTPSSLRRSTRSTPSSLRRVHSTGYEPPATGKRTDGWVTELRRAMALGQPATQPSRRPGSILRCHCRVPGVAVRSPCLSR